MRKIYIYSVLTCVLAFAACDKGFDELNRNQVSPTAINPAFILNNAVVNSSFEANSLVYDVGIVQQMVTPNSGVLTGANFNQDNRNSTLWAWQRYYRNVIRNTAETIALVKDDPARSNLLHMARILQSFAFMVLTDSYGDIPYRDAGKGFTEQILFPKYDSQQSIYTDLIKELTEATAALDASKPTESVDVLYGGSIPAWKKFGNSLLLRAGMRLVKVDAALAQSTVQRAAQSPLMDANADNAIVRHDNNYTNSVSGTLNGSEANNYYLAEPFVNQLKSTNDPRLRSIAVRYVGARSGPEQAAARASIDPTVQIGMPLGRDNNTIAQTATSLNLASFYDFSQLDRTRMAKLTAPAFLVTAAQTQLLLAEAAQRGWNVGGSTAATLFQRGIRLHMEQLAAYGADVAIPAAAIDAYITATPYVTTTGLEQINTQYWIASFLNGPEAFANFRRSGFPALRPNPFAGKDIAGEFIRRLTYPNSEIAVNSENVQAAIGRMGADKLDTRVWWDKQ